ncbi:hypothetical protein [Modestobacter lapidis]|nr:hypothetical protein [Modestobacter lapidis]
MVQHDGRRARRRRGLTALAAAVLALTGVAGCTDPAEPAPSAGTTEGLADLRDRVDTLEGRVDTLEDRVATLEDSGSSTPAAPADPSGEAPADGGPPGEGFPGIGEDLVGRTTSVRAVVAEVIPSTGVGTAFRADGGTGDPIAVLSAVPFPELDRGDVVEVSGTVVRVRPDTFEADFGVAADALLEEPDAFLAAAGGDLALSADRIDVFGEGGD